MFVGGKEPGIKGHREAVIYRAFDNFCNCCILRVLVIASYTNTIRGYRDNFYDEICANRQAGFTGHDKQISEGCVRYGIDEDTACDGVI